jgi:hypothetical protein
MAQTNVVAVAVAVKVLLVQMVQQTVAQMVTAVLEVLV